IDVTKRLLDNGADMEAEDNALYTPLWRAAYYGHPEVVEVLLDKGANRLARNKKGRKPGDVFSPTVEDDKKERIKIMLGMGTADASAQPAAASTPAAASAASTAATSAVENGVQAARGTGGTVGGKGGSAGGSSYKGNGDVSGSTAGVPPPAYKPPMSARPDPAPSAASLADSSYQYPDPSPANSPSSAMLNSTATVMSEAVLSTAVGESGRGGGTSGATSMENGGGLTGAGGGSGGEPKQVSVGVGGSGKGSATSRSAAGVQTTPRVDVNGSAEMNRIKAELSAKNQQLQQMQLKVEEYKDNLHQQAQTTSTRELDDADVQVEQLNQRIAASEAELERKKQEVGEARKEVENTERTSEERIAQLEHDLRMARSQSKGCQCTIS
ncbi:unnamed protein product, partial [Ectocarpus sp. 12 AP-2014]